MSKMTKPIIIQSIIAIILLTGCPYAKTFTFDKDTRKAFKNKYVCDWAGFDDFKMTAAEKSAFVNKQLDPVTGINDPLDFWYTFNAPPSADFLDIKKLEGEYQPLMYNGKYVSKKTGQLIDRKDFTSPKEVVYISVIPKLENNICGKKADSDNKVPCPRTTPVCMTFTKLHKEGEGEKKDENPTTGTAIGTMGDNTFLPNLGRNRRLLGLNPAIGVKIDIRMYRCFAHSGRFNEQTQTLSWKVSRNPWLMEFIHGETWVKMDYYNPFLHEQRIDQTFNRPCYAQTFRESAMIGPSFFPVFNKSRAKKFTQNPVKYCNDLDNKLRKRPAKIAHTLGLTDCNTTVEMTNHGHGYKGIFKAGQSNDACIRFSYGTQPKRDGSAPPNASFGLKIFRDNKPACDIVAMWSFGGQTTPNVFQNPLSNNIANIAVPFGSEKLGHKFHRNIRETKITQDRPGLISSHKCAKFDGSGFDEEAADPNAAEPFPWALMFVPNPLLQKLCELYNPDDKNPFDCFSELAQTTQFEELWAQNKVKLALEAVDDQDVRSEFPNDDLDAEKTRLLQLKDVEGGQDEPDIQQFKSMIKVTEQMNFMRKQLYKIVALDEPMEVEEVSQDPKSFRCLGYVKRKNAGAFTTNYFSDHWMRFSHDFWRVEMFNQPTKRNGAWWGRDEKTAEKWFNAAFSWKFKEFEGPKDKFWPAYQNHFVPGLGLEDTDFAKYIYFRSKDYMKCETKAQMEA